MQFVEFANICKKIEEIPGRLETADILAAEFPDLSEDELPVFVRFMRGKLFPRMNLTNTGSSSS